MAHVRPLRTRRGIARQRGAAVFIVLMAITLLTAVGLYAARTAMLVDQGSGFDRQAMQAHYLAVYGTLAASSELSGTRGSAHLNVAIDSSDNCPSLVSVPGIKYCQQMFMGELAATVDSNFSGHKLLEPAANGSPFVPGSLGPYPPSTGAAVNGDFMVEVTEPIELPVSVGYRVGKEDLVNYQVTLTSHGLIGAGTACDATTTTAGEELVRAHVIVGPMPRK